MSSEVIDRKIVSMEFDNDKFEKGVSRTKKSIENLVGSIKSMGETISDNNAPFIKMVAQITAVKKVTEDTIDVVKKFTKAVTIDPMKSGMEEYETQINAIQTILANTQHAGTTLKEVTAALDELNVYADKTIYNFTEMTRNIGTFTAAGIKLKDAVSSIQGIANLAAVSGANSQKASVAMYQLSQALAAGSLKLQDWNSVVNAGMGGKVFQDALKETARLHGVEVDKIIKKEGSFRESLKHGWISSEILTETLSKFTVSGANEYISKMTGMLTLDIEAMRKEADASGDVNKAYREMAKTLSQSSELTEDQIYSLLNMSKTAEGAATEVKTFTQLMDNLKQAMQSGWTKTWELIVGDFEQAKVMFTDLSNTFGAIIEDFSNTRNEVVGMAMNSSWETLSGKIKGAELSVLEFQNRLIEAAGENGVFVKKLMANGTSFEDTLKNGWLSQDIITQTLSSYIDGMDQFAKATGQTIYSLKEYETVVDDVISGKYGSGKERVEELTKAGYDYFTVTKLVGAKINRTAIDWDNLTTAELRNLGLSEEQISRMKKLKDQIEDTSDAMNDIANSMNKPSGRSKMLQALKNSLTAISKIINTVRRAFNDVFNIKHTDLINIIEVFEKFTEKMANIVTESNDFYRTMKGLFSIVGMVTDTFTELAKIIYVKLGGAINEADFSLLHFTAFIGDHLVELRNWLKENNLIVYTIGEIIDKLVIAGKAVYNFATSVLTFDNFSKGLRIIESWLRNFVSTIKKYTNLDLSFIPNFIDELATINEVSFNPFYDSLTYLVNKVKIAINKILDPLSWFNTEIKKQPKNVQEEFDKETEELIIESEKQANVLKSFFSHVLSTLSWYRTKIEEGINNIISFFKSINIGSIIGLGISLASLMVMNKIIKSLTNFADTIVEVVAPLSGASKQIKKVLKNFSNLLKKMAFTEISRAVLMISESVLMLASSMFILSKIDNAKVGEAIGNLALMVAMIAALVAVVMGLSALQKTNVVLSPAILAIGMVSALFMAISYALTKVDDNTLAAMNTMFNFTKKFVAFFGAITAALILFVKFIGPMTITSIQSIILPMLLLGQVAAVMSGVMLAFSKVDVTGFKEKFKLLITVFLMMTSLMATMLVISLLLGKWGIMGPAAAMSGPATTMMAFGVSMYLIIKTFSDLTPDKIQNAKSSIIKFAGFLALMTVISIALIAATRLVGPAVKETSIMLISIGAAISLLIGSIITLGIMPYEILKKGGILVSNLMFVFGLLILASHLAGKYVKDCAPMLLAAAASIVVLVGSIYALGFADDDIWKKGLGSVMAMLVSFGAMLAFTKKVIITKSFWTVMGSIIALCTALTLTSIFGKIPTIITTALGLSTVIGVLIRVIKTINTGPSSRLSATMAKTLQSLMGIIIAIGGSISAILLINGITGGNLATISVAAAGLAGCMAVLIPLIKSLQIMATATINKHMAKNIIALIAPILAISGAISAILLFSDGNLGAIAVAGAFVIGGMAILIPMMYMLKQLATSVTIVPFTELLKGLGVLAIAIVALGGAVALICWLTKDLNTTLDQLVGVTALCIGLGVVAGGLGVLAGIIGKIGPDAFIGVGVIAALLAAVAGIAGLFIDWAIVPAIQEISNAGEGLKEAAEGMNDFADVVKTLPTVELDEITDFLDILFRISDTMNGISDPEDNASTFDRLKKNTDALMPVLQTFADGVKKINNFSDAKAAMDILKSLVEFVDETKDLDFINNGLYNTPDETFEIWKNKFEKYMQVIQFVKWHMNNYIDANELQSALDKLNKFNNTFNSEFLFNTSELINLMLLYDEGSWLKYTNGLEALIGGIKSFTMISTKENINEDDLDYGIKCIEKLCDLQKKLPSQWNVLDWFFGKTKQDWDSFGNGLGSLGKSMKDFSDEVKGITISDFENGLSALELLADVADRSKFDNVPYDWSVLGNGLDAVGLSINKFSNALGENKLSGLVAFDARSTMYALEDLRDIIAIFGSIKEMGIDTNYLLDFDLLGNNFENLGTIIYDFINKIAPLRETGLYTKTTVDRILGIFDLIDGYNIDWSRCRQLCTTLHTLASSVKEYANGTSGINSGSFYTIASGIETLSKALITMSLVNPENVDSFSEALEKLLNSGIEDLVNVYSSAEDEFIKMGEKISDSIEKGIENKRDDLKSLFHSFGRALIISLANGMSKHEEVLTAIEKLGSDIREKLEKEINKPLSDSIKKTEVTINNSKSGGIVDPDVVDGIVESANGMKKASVAISNAKTSGNVITWWTDGLETIEDLISQTSNYDEGTLENLVGSVLQSGKSELLSDFDYDSAEGDTLIEKIKNYITNKFGTESAETFFSDLIKENFEFNPEELIDTGEYTKQFTGFSSKISQAASDARTAFDEYFDDYKEGRITQMEFDDLYANNMASAQAEINQIYSNGLKAIEDDYANGKYSDNLEQYAEDKKELYKDYTDALSDLSKHTTEKIQDYAETTMNTVGENFEKKIEDIQKKMDDFSSKLQTSLTDAMTFTTKGDIWDKEDEAFDEKTEKLNEYIDKLSDSKEDLSLIYGDEASSIMSTQENLDKLIHTRDKYEKNTKEWRRAQQEIDEIMYGKKDDDTKKKIDELKEEQKQYQIGSSKWKELEKQIIETERGFSGLLSSNKNFRYFANLQKMYDKEKYNLEDSQKEYEQAKKDRDDESRETIESVEFTNTFSKNNKKLKEYEGLLKELRDKPGVSQEMLSELSGLDIDKGMATVKYWLTLSEKQLTNVSKKAAENVSISDSIANIIHGDEMRDAIAEFYQNVNSSLASLPESAKYYGEQSILRYIEGLTDATSKSIESIGYSASIINQALSEGWSNEQFVLTGLGDRLGSGMKTALEAYMCSDQFKMELGSNTVTALLDGVKANLNKPENQLTITPVLHMPSEEEILTPLRTLQDGLDAKKLMELNVPGSLLSISSPEQAKTTEAVDNQTVTLSQKLDDSIQAIKDLVTKYGDMYSYITTNKMDVTLDSGVLVGELTPKVNKELGNRQTARRRGS